MLSSFIAIRDLALFNLAIDSKLRACDLVKIRVHDIAHDDSVARRAIVLQQKTQRPVQFEITEQTRIVIQGWIAQAALRPAASRVSACAPTSTYRTPLSTDALPDG